MNQLGLFDPEPEARGEDAGAEHSCPRAPRWFWRGFTLSRHGWTLEAVGQVESACIRVCRGILADSAYKCGYRVERVDYPAY